ncbi:MAG TPA: hypothetical protein VFH72_09775 [Candidatus Baltobacteraceae bacterium]|nr:hypothetical protein [Candidatus Baltobacteraceae bacterium]
MHVLRVAVGLLAIVALSCLDAAASPNFRLDDPIRPKNSRLLLATTGVFVSYDLIATDALLSPRITIFDEIAHQKRTFSLSFNTKVNGQVLQCDDAPVSAPWMAQSAIEKYKLCDALPHEFKAGATRITLLYWTHETSKRPDALNDFDLNPETDALWLVSDAPNASLSYAQRKRLAL